MSKTYADRLRDPRWQRRRLEVLNRAGWACESCGDKEKTLHVHHRIYRRGANPWEYDDHELQSLCEDCHETTERWRKRLTESIAGLSDWELRTVVGFSDGLLARSSGKVLDVSGFDHAVGMVLATIGANCENTALSKIATRLSEIAVLCQSDTDWLGEFDVSWAPPYKEPEGEDGAENQND